VVIWGDGAVGTGMAVALSSSRRVVLVGPRGAGRGPARIESIGAYPGTAEILRSEPDDHPRGDACMVAVKSYDLREVSRGAEASSDADCICLSNGMGLEAEWGSGWAERVEPALLTAGFRLVSPSAVATTRGTIIVRSHGSAEALLSETPIPLETTSGLETARWGKWLANSVINPLGALTGLPNDKLLEAGLGPLIHGLAAELIVIVPPALREAAADCSTRMLAFLLESSPNMCSMLQDLEAGRKTEISNLTGLCRVLKPEMCPSAEVLTALVRAREVAGQGS
jgi:2-dehydropantoate 2-reductase